MASIRRVGTTGSVGGIEITENNMQEVLDGLSGAVEKALTEIGIKAEKYAKNLCPVGTPESTGWTDKNGVRHPNKGYRGGTLRNSITFEVDGSELSVGSNVEYAPYVELGTGPNFTPPPEWEQFTTERGSGGGSGYVRPRKFLQPAITEHVDMYKRIIETELKNA